MKQAFVRSRRIVQETESLAGIARSFVASCSASFTRHSDSFFRFLRRCILVDDPTVCHACASMNTRVTSGRFFSGIASWRFCYDQTFLQFTILFPDEQAKEHKSNYGHNSISTLIYSTLLFFTLFELLLQNVLTLYLLYSWAIFHSFHIFVEILALKDVSFTSFIRHFRR